MKADTGEMRKIASEVNALAVEYQTKLSQLYAKFSNMPEGTKEWVGDKAVEYVGYVLQDKNDLMSVGDKIKSLGQAIADDATAIDYGISVITKGEANE